MWKYLSILFLCNNEFIFNKGPATKRDDVQQGFFESQTPSSHFISYSIITMRMLSTFGQPIWRRHELLIRVASRIKQAKETKNHNKLVLTGPHVHPDYLTVTLVIACLSAWHLNVTNGNQVLVTLTVLAHNPSRGFFDNIEFASGVHNTLQGGVTFSIQSIPWFTGQMFFFSCSLYINLISRAL